MRFGSKVREAFPDKGSRGAWLATWADDAIVALLILYGLVVLGALLLAPMRYLPAEDVVILHQYARNLATHGSITYYPGGPHAEGATDFGWMLLVAAAFKAGIPPTALTAAVNVASLSLLALTLLRLAQLRWTAWRVLALAGAAGLFPQIIAAASGFAVLPDALLLAWLSVAVLQQRTALAALSALCLCLFRLDGVLFAAPLLVSLLWKRGERAPRSALLALCFLLPGIVFFLWRAHYFGQWLPLPLLVKGDVRRAFGLLVPHSFWASTKYLALDAVLFTVLLRRGRIRPSLLLVQLSLIAVPTLFYWSMRLDQNVGDRFYFYLPLAAAILLASEWSTLKLQQQRTLLRTGVAAFLVFLLGPLRREFTSFRDYQFRDVQKISAGLGRLPAGGSLLTSEAGFLTYGSGWTAYDAWGLNTARFAGNLIQPEDVVSLKTDLIVVHPELLESCTPNADWRQFYKDRTWQHMVRNVTRGAQQAGNYELWQLSYGSEYRRKRMHWAYGEGDKECFFVRKDSPQYHGMVQLLNTYHGRLNRDGWSVVPAKQSGPR